MPKLVDTSARSAVVYPAVCRIVSSDGVSAATVRRVAEEAGLSPQARKWQEDCWTWRTDDAATYVMILLWAMVPLDADARIRAQAWAAYARQAGDDSTLAEVVRQHDRERVMLVGRALDMLRREHSTTPAPSRVVLPDDFGAATPDILEPEALHMLALVRGLTALVCDHALPLSPEVAGRWLDAWDPALGGRACRDPN